MTSALLVIDVQNDFVEGGALGCTGGKELAYKIKNQLDELAVPIVISSQDWHDADNDNGGHFSDHPDHVNSWERHCVAMTTGAFYAPPLMSSMFDYRILKGQGKPAYSAFQGTEAKSHRTLDEILRARQVTELFVTGIATDYCVKETVKDALQYGYNVTVVADLCVPVSEETGNRALVDMEIMGANIIRLDQTEGSR